MPMLRRAVLPIGLSLLVAACAPRLPLYRSEAAAVQGCKGDQIVWANTESGVYHLRGTRHYANTSYGGFACRTEVEKFGYRGGRG